MLSCLTCRTRHRCEPSAPASDSADRGRLSPLDAFDAASGRTLARRPLSADAGAPVTDLTSSGVAIAEHEVLAAAGGLSYEAAPGYVIAYRVP